MADNPYAVLGVSKSASDTDIRRAFRRLAKELHPDVKPNDAAAAERFKKISQAYELLGDPDKRRKFDAGEIDADGEARSYQHAYAGGQPFGGRSRRGPAGADEFGFGDIFSEFFGQSPRGAGARSQFASKGQDVRYTLDVEFLEAVHGTRKRVTLPEGGVLDINVPEGVADGQVLRLKGKGQPGFAGGSAGDALVEIKVAPHPVFAREGDVIRSTIAVAIDEAILGGKIAVPTVAGDVQLTVPKGTSSGRTLRLRGKGVKNMKTGATGDHLVTLQIVLPDVIDESLSYFMTEWRQANSYNPRKT
ncbi:MAG: DnaJ C-terminal domain-containing protein [Pseudomonadota bacterium]